MFESEKSDPVKKHLMVLICCHGMFMAGSAFAQEVAAPAHQQQMEELAAPTEPTDDQLQVLQDQQTFKDGHAGDVPRAPRRAESTIGDDFIVFGYIQSESQLPHTRWESLTHVASGFVEFNTNGNLIPASLSANWTNRDTTMRAGGAAQNAGCKVIMTVLNDNFDVNVINTVMASSTARTNLVTDIAAAVTSDGYCAGVTFDFEPFSWNSTATAGMTLFFQQLRAALPSPYEISIYADPTPSASRWDLPGLTPSLDYYLYSCYDYATGQTPHAISDFDGYITQINDFYIDGGVPSSKMVAVISSYSGRWEGTNTYNVSGGNDRVAGGFTDGLYETTLWPSYGGPQTEIYRDGDEVSWHTWNDGLADYVRTWDSPTALEYKIRAVVSNIDTTATPNNKGKRLRGVGFWSLMWMAETTSINLVSQEGTVGGSVSRTRTYPHIYQLCQEILKTPGTTKFLITGFEGNDPRWRDPNANPDAVNLGTATDSEGIVTAPAGAGRPSSTNKCAEVTFTFSAGATQQMAFEHELLADSRATTVVDTNAPAALLTQNTRVSAYIYTPTAYAGRTVRMLAYDGSRELEMSPAYSLGIAGWREITWDFTDASQTTGFNTNDPRFIDGDGVIDSAGGGKKDIGFFGFLVQGGGAGSGTIDFDEIMYEHTNPGGQNFKINEFRYAGVGGEFVEIHGPAGQSTPAGLQLRLFSGTTLTGAAYTTLAIGGQTIPANGLLVVGDPAVTNVDLSAGMTDAADDILDTNPCAIQIYDTATGNVYDSVVYEARGGLSGLMRAPTLGVTDEGFPWMGEATTYFSLGRYPDGADTQINFDDFSGMVASPGTSNGGTVSIPATFNFSSTPAGMYQTYQPLAGNIGASGVGASPSGGNVYRCVDTTGGGNNGFIGDAALGYSGGGYSVTGEIFVPNSAAPAQANGVGLCGSHGSTFFSGSPNGSGYDAGYWLIFENTGGVGLNDGRPDHGDTFEFIWPQQEGNAAISLGSLSRTAAGVTAGTWTTFGLSIDPVSNSLMATVNGVTVYNGPIPTGGPTSGSVQVGFRENHVGNPSSVEGTWVDNIQIGSPWKAHGWIISRSDRRSTQCGTGRNCDECLPRHLNL